MLKKLYRRARRYPKMIPGRLLAWALSTYVAELLVLPILYFVGLGMFSALVLVLDDWTPLLLWSGAFLLLQFNAGAFFLSVHNDRLKLLQVLPLFGLYNGFILNSAWLISVVDELRGRRMRW